MSFCIESWQERLASALYKLEATQAPYLEKHWQCYGYPATTSFNGKDETPYPSSDVQDLYDTALRSSNQAETAYFKALRSALDPVRGILRSHPAIGSALGRVAGNDKFMVEIVNGTSLTWLTLLVVGLMERANELSDNDFETAAGELGVLLEASRTSKTINVPNGMDIGYDVLLFFGPKIERQIQVEPNLLVVPFAELLDWVDPDWIRDFLPEQMDRRDWRQIGAIMRPFHWRPHLHQMNRSGERAMQIKPRFEEEAWSFLELLAVANQTPIIPFVFIDDCIHRTAFLLLGISRNSGGRQTVGNVGKSCDPFREPPKLHQNAIEVALDAFETRRKPSYQQLAPVRRRLAEALARDGRFLLDDRILDVSQSIELMFEIKGTGIGKKIQSAMSDLLAIDSDHSDEVRKATKQFYDVRSAIVHGPSDDYRKRLMRLRGQAFRSGFNLAQQAYFKLIHERT
ncbi:hypothetical protein [Aliiroseovarius marinus]|uniref:hypothetical protein n=1 Tax=Aliiroseovarius marinus TaxID=2500159 RepID=UPI003D7E682D